MLWSLRKWYLDCVASDGTAWIGYQGELRCGPLRMPFCSSLLASPGRIRTSSARAAEEPKPAGAALTWAPRALRLEAAFSPRARLDPRTLQPGVSWHCAMPAGEGIVRVGSEELRGLGYAEVLEMTVAPWTLPIATLRWGRFVSARTSMVWIEWQGGSPLVLCIRDGAEAPDVTVGDDAVGFGDGTTLALAGRRTLREESLGTTLAPLGPAALLLPRRLRGAVERKWLSRGTVVRDGAVFDEGWVIHERLDVAA